MGNLAEIGLEPTCTPPIFGRLERRKGGAGALWDVADAVCNVID